VASLRVGVVSAEYPPAIGGVGDHAARLARELASAGHTVEVLTSRAPVVPSDASQPVEVLRVIKRWDWRILWQIPRIARERDWDLLHIQYQPAAYRLHGAINLLPLGMRVRQTAVVTTFHDLRFPYLFPKAGRLRRGAVALLAKASDAAIAVDEADAETLARWRSSRGPATTQHVPLGDQLDADPPAGFVAEEWRARLDLAPDHPVIAHVGLVNRSKGVLDLVEALAQLPEAHLLMIGEKLGASDTTNAAYLGEVNARVGALGVAARMHWTGFVEPPELAAWLGIADVVALPFLDGASLRRTSLITAWRRGVPVVTTEPGGAAGWRSTPPGGTAASFVSPRDPIALAAALRGVLSSPGQRKVLTHSAREFAQRFSWPAVTRGVEAVYRAAISARPKRRRST